MSAIVQKIPLADKNEALLLLGRKDAFLKILENGFNVTIIGRGNEIALKGKQTNVTLAQKAIDKILSLSKNSHHLREEDILLAIQMVKEEKETEFDEIMREKIEVSSKRKHIIPHAAMHTMAAFVHRDNMDAIVSNKHTLGCTFIAKRTTPAKPAAFGCFFVKIQSSALVLLGRSNMRTIASVQGCIVFFYRRSPGISPYGPMQ